MGGDHHILAGIPVKLSLPGILQDRTELHVALGVTDPGGRPEEYRKTELLGEGEGVADHVVGLLDGGRIEAGYPGEFGIHPAVLLILRRMSVGIIGAHDDQSAGHTGIRAGHERIGSHVQTDVFHGAERTNPAPGRSQGIFKGHLLIDRPLCIVTPIGKRREHLDHFR